MKSQAWTRTARSQGASFASIEGGECHSKGRHLRAACRTIHNLGTILELFRQYRGSLAKSCAWRCVMRTGGGRAAKEAGVDFGGAKDLIGETIGGVLTCESWSLCLKCYPGPAGVELHLVVLR